eukprot:m.340823 g.340823  ORF g.340823 m.340823 type:complete len:372 (+) comp19579_c0_seq1:180-1295(+)
MPGEEDSSLAALVQAMIGASNKGAAIARMIKENGSKRMSIEKKPDREKGSDRAVPDFMTVADLLLQKVITRELTAKVPGSAEIFGEEDDDASSLPTGEVIRIGDTPGETHKNLTKQFLGDSALAHRITQVIHSEANVMEDLSMVQDDCDFSQIGFWIDPIDCTQAYIKELKPKVDREICLNSALPAVTILIGAYHIKTGEPVAGVVNQPFYSQKKKLGKVTWSGCMFWGTVSGENKHWGASPEDSHRAYTRERPLIVHSKHEPVSFLNAFKSCDRMPTPGSGYKGLCVLTGLADVYYLSLPTTYKWDTCATHAVATAMGGTVVRADDLQPVKYTNIPGDKHLNEGGFILVTSRDILDDLLKTGEITEFLSL